MGLAEEIPPETTIVLAHLLAPRLANREGKDQPFAWKSREFLRKLCIGEVVVFKTVYTIPNTNREFCSVLLDDSTNIAEEVVQGGWAKVKEARGRRVTRMHAELLHLEQIAKINGKGLWDKSPRAIAAAVRNLAPSAVANPWNLKAKDLGADKNKLEAIVEHVRDGSCLYVYLQLPSGAFQFVKVFVAGIQAASMGRRNNNNNDESKSTSSTENEVSPEYGWEAKHYTEIRVLSRVVRIASKGFDKYGCLVGTVYYPAGTEEKNLALELIKNGFAKYVDWSASKMDVEAQKELKAAELEAKNNKLKMWTNYVPPSPRSQKPSPKAVSNNLRATKPKAVSKNFTGQVTEVVSGDCIIVADDSVPFGSPGAERRINLSCIKCPNMANPDEKSEPYAREARELLRRRLIGRQVQVSMEYVPTANGSTDQNGTTETQVFLLSQGKDSEDVSPAAGGQEPGLNVAQLIISRGFGTVVKYRDNNKERSHYYKKLLEEESGAVTRGKGIHSFKIPPVMHVTDLTTASQKAKEYLPTLQRNKRMAAIVEHVLSGYRYKIFVPKDACSIVFSLSGVKCPVRKEPYSDEAMSLMRRKLMQRDVEIEVETVRNGAFVGCLWESNTNAGVTLLEAGLARLQTSFEANKITDGRLLAEAEQLARKQKLKIWSDVNSEADEKDLSANGVTSKAKT
nr:ribonuclease TUDOR 1-like isoform X2 [Erigeron canadensis]